MAPVTASPFPQWGARRCRLNADAPAPPITFKTLLTEQNPVAGVVVTQPSSASGHRVSHLQRMISIHRCILENDQWQRVERYHVGRGFALMSEAVEYAETLNRQTWERFDWIKEPTEAFLAVRD